MPVHYRDCRAVVTQHLCKQSCEKSWILQGVHPKVSRQIIGAHLKGSTNRNSSRDNIRMFTGHPVFGNILYVPIKVTYLK